MQIEVIQMELNNRKREILAAIIKTYIETGEPVGSKMLCTLLGTNLSSATLRNEMSDLCEMGYLKQPHTSAGRTPTSSGIRFYLSQLMPTSVLDEQLKSRIDSMVKALPNDTESLIPAAAQSLSKLTGLPSISAVMESRGVKVSAAGAVRIGSRSVLVSLLTSSGMSGSRVCKNIWPVTDAQIAKFNKIAEHNIKDISLSEFGAARMQTISLDAGDDSLALSNMFACIFELACELNRPRISVKGAASIYGFSEFAEDAGKLLEFTSRHDLLLSLLNRVSAPVAVVLGEDSGIAALKSAGLVIAGYNIGGIRAGRLGVLGPIRLNYQRLIPSIEYFSAGIAKKLSAVFESED